MPTKRQLEEKVQDLEATVAQLQLQLSNPELGPDHIRDELAALVGLDWSSIYDEDGRVLPMKEWPDVARRYVKKIEVHELVDKDGALYGVIKKIELPDKLLVLDKLGRHRAVDAFNPDAVIQDERGIAEEIVEARRRRRTLISESG